MKMQILTAVLVSMCLTANCIPVNARYNCNSKLRSHRSPIDDGYNGPMGQTNGFSQDPQFNDQPSTDGVYGPNEESDGNFQVHLQPNTPLETDQTVQGIVTESPNVDVTVTQNTVSETPAKEDRETDSDEDDSDEDDASDLWNISKIGNKNVPSINFFPVLFGIGRGRSGGFPTGTVAIANSFSTGRKGVATSTANANRNEISQSTK